MSQTDEPDFGALMSAANCGDAEAYTRLLRALTPIIRQIARRQRYFTGADEVEDVVQDVLLSVHSVRGTYDAARPFMPWLVAIVKRRIIDAGRRHARHATREIAFDEHDVTFAAPAANTLEGDHAALDALRIAVERLPRGQREAIELLKMKELSLREASAATGVSIGALKVAAHRAMAALRATLKRYEH